MYSHKLLCFAKITLWPFFKFLYLHWFVVANKKTVFIWKSTNFQFECTMERQWSYQQRSYVHKFFVHNFMNPNISLPNKQMSQLRIKAWIIIITIYIVFITVVLAKLIVKPDGKRLKDIAAPQYFKCIWKVCDQTWKKPPCWSAL